MMGAEIFFVLRNLSLSASGWFPALMLDFLLFFFFFYTSFFKIAFLKIASLYLPISKIIDIAFLLPVLPAAFHCKEHNQKESNTFTNHLLFIFQSTHLIDSEASKILCNLLEKLFFRESPSSVLSLLNRICP